MILPIVLYGDPILKKKAEEIAPGYKGLQELITNMFETMYAADGVGFAAPQMGLSISLFVVDSSPFVDDYPEAKDFKRIFINPEIISEEGEEWRFNEGCLSFPALREDVIRKPIIQIRYLDENFMPHEDTFDGINARIIQHEYDHLKGIVFVDRITYLKKTLIKKKLTEIINGNVNPTYKVKAYVKKKIIRKK